MVDTTPQPISNSRDVEVSLHTEGDLEEDLEGDSELVARIAYGDSVVYDAFGRRVFLHPLEAPPDAICAYCDPRVSQDIQEALHSPVPLSDTHRAVRFSDTPEYESDLDATVYAYAYSGIVSATQRERLDDVVEVMSDEWCVRLPPNKPYDCSVCGCARMVLDTDTAVWVAARGSREDRPEPVGFSQRLRLWSRRVKAGFKCR